ncbi:phage tail protein [Erythrobacteraceae bacterium WH01K]|nr:phage tail protein [Erythrobacteraceae bacterium WH01K]
MATLLLTAVGTMVGGPLGGAIGALAGRQLDSAIIGGGSRGGPRLKELDVSTSSYGQPIARHHGVSRSGGSIIWATDLVESTQSSGGGKGRPSTTSYSYSISFAVALSSRPIRGIGRIWADGNLLRGAGGDLKAGGTLRLHTGEAGQQPDPLIASAQGEAAPAFRGTAYAVFEDLQLGDFGNRIPALTFEVLADDGDVDLASIVAPSGAGLAAGSALEGLTGFAAEGGPVAGQLSLLGQLYPLSVEATGDTLRVSRPQIGPDAEDDIPLLPIQSVGAWEGEDFGQADGIAARRTVSGGPDITGVRHYDPARDYQPGIQRAGGQAPRGRPEIIEFPATLSATRASALANEAAERSVLEGERIAWRMAEIDPAIGPGRHVRLPGRHGIYRITSWEWRERAVELELVKAAEHRSSASQDTEADPGRITPPADIVAGPSRLMAFGLPWNGSGDPNTPRVFAALTTSPPGTSAMLHTVEQDQLVPLAPVRGNALQGALEEPLPPSPALRYEGGSALLVRCAGDDSRLAPASLEALANGANRLLVGREIVQFSRPAPLGEGLWKLEGLLRGRGATEGAASAGHAAGTPVAFLDERLAALDPAIATAGPPALAAIALGDNQPVEAIALDPLCSLRPPSPVHPVFSRQANGGVSLRWIRRARGAWTWPDGVDAPLVEESESYLVGIGPLASPHASWVTSSPAFVIDGEAIADLAATGRAGPVWVRQQGTHAASDALVLGHL